MGCVYLLWAVDSARYKIGMTKEDDPAKRIASIATSCPFPVQLIGGFVTDTPEIYEAEMHEKWGEKRVNREWFNFSPVDFPSLSKDFQFYSVSGYLDGVLCRYSQAFNEALDKCFAHTFSRTLDLINERDVKNTQILAARNNKMTELTAKWFLKQLDQAALQSAQAIHEATLRGFEMGCQYASESSLVDSEVIEDPWACSTTA